MHNVLMVPMWVMITLIILAWVGVVYLYWFKPQITPKVNDYFAQRRAMRRRRNYTAWNVAAPLNNYNQKGPAHAPARHRR